MRDFLIFVLLGLGPGAVHALLGLGLVAIYRGSGVLNFAHGAMGMYVAFVFVTLRQDQGLSRPLALALSIAAAALLGLVVYLLVMRPLRNAPVLARVTGTLGVLLTLQAVAQWQFGSRVRSVDPIVPAGSFQVLGVNLAYDRLLLLVVAVLLCAGLWAVYRYTLFGLATSAAAETEKGAAVTGYSQARLAAVNWMIGAALAGIGGILIAPLTRLDTVNISLLVVPALAAALLGRFQNVWVVLLGGLMLGVGEALVTRFLPGVTGLTASLPFLVIAAVLVLRGRSMPSREETIKSDLPLAPAPHRVTSKLLVGGALLLTLMAVLPNRLSAALTIALLGGLVVLSLVVVVGYVGQISLCQLAFSGVGAYMAIRGAQTLGLGFLSSVLFGAAVATVVGVLVGLPALRVRGINLAVITLGAGLAIERMYFNSGSLTGGELSQTPPPVLAGLLIDGRLYPERYGTFVAVVLLLAMAFVYRLRGSVLGRQMLAVRSDEGSAAAAGINVTRIKLQAFAISAFLAGLAGALAAYRTTRVEPQNFAVFGSISYLAIAYIGGIATVGSAAVAALFVPGGPVGQLLRRVVDFPRLVEVLSGVGLIITVVTQPDGVANVIKNERAKRATKRRRREAESQRGHDPSDEPATLSSSGGAQ